MSAEDTGLREAEAVAREWAGPAWENRTETRRRADVTAARNWLRAVDAVRTKHQPTAREGRLCDGCNVREPFEHRCHGEPCPCEECREADRLFVQPTAREAECQHDDLTEQTLRDGLFVCVKCGRADGIEQPPVIAQPAPVASAGGRLSEEERAEIIETGRHVYGCCSDGCEYHGLPEDAQIAAVERILAARLAAAWDEGYNKGFRNGADLDREEHMNPYGGETRG